MNILHYYTHKLFDCLWQETERLVLWIPIAFAFGCLIYFNLSFEPSIRWCLIIPIVTSICLIVFYSFNQKISLEIYHIGWALWFVSVGFSWAWWQTYLQEPFYQVPTRSTIIQGAIDRIEILPTGKQRVVIRYFHFLTPPESDQQLWKRKLQITLSSKDTQKIDVGDLVQARVMLSRPASPVMVGGYDFQFQAWFHHIGAYGYALEPVIIIHKETSASSLQALREHIADHIRTILPNNSGVIAQILLTGIDGALSQQDRHAFSASGLAHLLAIAGLHLGIVMMIITITVRWILLRSEYIALYFPVKTIAVISGWLFGCGYLFLTGMHIPAMRSLLMASIIVLAIIYHRPVISKYNLMIAALCLLILSPASVLNVSFQMSMAAVLALVSGYHLIYKWLGYRDKEISFLRRFFTIYLPESMWVSILAGTAVIPIVMFYFYELNLYYIFANVIAVPLTAFWIMPLGIISLCMMPFGLDTIFLQLMGIGIDCVIYIANWVSNFPYANIPIAFFPSWGLVLYFFGLCILCLCITSLRWIGCLLMMMGVFSVIFVRTPDILTTSNGRMVGIYNHHQLRIVCQGTCDSKIIQTWQKATLLSEVKLITQAVNDKETQCNENYCYFQSMHVLVTQASFKRDQTIDQLCHKAIIEVSFAWNTGACPNIISITKKDHWMNGAYAFQLHPLSIRTDLQKRGHRPWVMEPIQRGVPKLPMAQSE